MALIAAGAILVALPQAVIDVTAAYLEAEDALAAWIGEECERRRTRGSR